MHIQKSCSVYQGILNVTNDKQTFKNRLFVFLLFESSLQLPAASTSLMSSALLWFSCHYLLIKVENNSPGPGHLFNDKPHSSVCVCLWARGSATAVTTLQHTALHPFILHSADQCEIRGQTTSSAACPCVYVCVTRFSSFPLACNWLCPEAKSLVITVCSRLLVKEITVLLQIDHHVD